MTSPLREQRTTEPGAAAWAVAFVGLVLPWVGLPVALLGLVLGLRNESLGWLLLATGLVLLALDVAIDLIWARMAASSSDEPDLNKRGSELVGRIVVVCETIAFGRGKIKAGDTVWIAEGADAQEGSRVRVLASEGGVLQVSQIKTRDG